MICKSSGRLLKVNKGRAYSLAPEMVNNVDSKADHTHSKTRKKKHRTLHIHTSGRSTRLYFQIQRHAKCESTVTAKYFQQIMHPKFTQVHCCLVKNPNWEWMSFSFWEKRYKSYMLKPNKYLQRQQRGQQFQSLSLKSVLLPPCCVTVVCRVFHECILETTKSVVFVAYEKFFSAHAPYLCSGDCR